LGSQRKNVNTALGGIGECEDCSAHVLCHFLK